ncbi:MAG TPA: GNAT family N-acetyltransferase, partial [Nitrolancea sp.]|nr:GNAT family N-acetyltransferase [Nitrolancea sp.]
MTIALLADWPRLASAVAEMRFREWATHPGREELRHWLEVTEREAGRSSLPLTWAAIAEDGTAIGAVGLGEFDPPTHQDRTPWVLGMIVRPDWRRQGIGRELLQALEIHAACLGFGTVWVATGNRGRPFYEACGWRWT